jgi:hypothetical protein
VAVFLDNAGDDQYSLSTPVTSDATASGFGFSSHMRGVAAFLDLGGNDRYSTPAPKQAFGVAEYAIVMSPDDKGMTRGSGLFGLSYFAYAASLGLFLDVGGTDRYPGADRNDSQWGDRPGTENWEVRNLGIGLDVPAGTVDWRPRSFPRVRARLSP